METQNIGIENIPALLWGPKTGKLLIAVHGDQSNKEDDVIMIVAEEAWKKGYQILSFDLPEHGVRKNEPRICKADNCVEDLNKVMKYAQTISDSISLFGCSTGAYFSMLAYYNEEIKQTLFLSPVVDMKRIIENMMVWFDVSEVRLEKEQEISTPIKTLYWDYYQYVLKHPVKWDKPTSILYGAHDNLCEFEFVDHFSKRVHADITILEEGEHFFHTETQLAFFREWLKRNIAV